MNGGDESGIDWRMETIDFSEGLLLELFLIGKEIRRAMQDELASSGCVWSPRGRRFLSKLANCEVIVFIRTALFFLHDMEHQSKGPQESSLVSIEILSMYVILLLPARPVPKPLSEITELLLALFTPVMPGKPFYPADRWSFLACIAYP